MVLRCFRSLLSLFAIVIIIYAVTTAVSHHHTTHQHNCPVCHLQQSDSTDIQLTTFKNVQISSNYPQGEQSYCLLIIAIQLVSRSPPLIAS